MNRKSLKVYTLVLTGAQVRALLLAANAGTPYAAWQNRHSYKAAHRALLALEAVHLKVLADEERP